MKRLWILLATLALAALLWAGLAWQNRQRTHFLATATRAQLEERLRAEPESPDLLARLGTLLREEGDREGAAERLKQAAERAPGEERYWVEYARALPDPRAGEQLLDSYLKDFPEASAARAERARRRLEAGDPEGARALAEEEIRRAPRSADAWRALGEALMAQRRLPEASAALQKSLDRNDEAETRLLLAQALVPQQRYAEVLSVCAPLLGADVPPVRRARALLYSAGSRLFSPQSPEQIAALQAQLNEAARLAGHLEPGGRFLPAYFLGESYLRLGRPTEAIPPLERAVADAPTFPGALYSLARAYQLAGDATRARRAFARHARLSQLLGAIDGLSSRLEQRPDDVTTKKRLDDAARRLERLGKTAGP